VKDRGGVGLKEFDFKAAVAPGVILTKGGEALYIVETILRIAMLVVALADLSLRVFGRKKD